MVQDGRDDLLIFDKTDDPHGAVTFWADEGIGLVDFLNHPGPAFPTCRWGSIGFDHVRDAILRGFLLPHPVRDIVVPAIVSDHLLSPIRDLLEHGSKPFACIEDLPISITLSNPLARLPRKSRPHFSMKDSIIVPSEPFTESLH